jgi:CheY-like chemotaxis protein
MRHAALPRKPRILIVEDDVDTRDILAMILEDEGYLVDVLDDGRYVASQVERERPDVITLDIGLPGRSGQAILDDLERNPVTSSIPVVIISGHTRTLTDPNRDRTSHVIAKPFYVTQVLEEIQRALAEGKPAEA